MALYRMPDGRIVDDKVQSLTGRDLVGAAKLGESPAPASVQAPVDNRPTTETTKYPFNSLLDENNNLLSQYRLNARPDVGFNSNLNELNSKLSGINLDKRALEALRERGLSTGDSAWGKLMLEKQALEEQDALGKAIRENASNRSGSMSALARSGGLSAGAKERLANQSMQDLANSRQDVARSGIMQRLGIRSDDEGKRLDILKSLPGMEVQALQPEFQKTSMWGQLADSESGRRQNLDLANRAYQSEIEKSNIANTLGVKSQEDAARLEKYKSDMAAYGAEQTAKAQAAAGGGKK